MLVDLAGVKKDKLPDNEQLMEVRGIIVYVSKVYYKFDYKVRQTDLICRPVYAAALCNIKERVMFTPVSD